MSPEDWGSRLSTEQVHRSVPISKLRADASPGTKPGAELDDMPDGGINISFEALDGDGLIAEVSYSERAELTGRFAAGVIALGAQRGDRVATLLSRGADLHTTALGTMKAGVVFCPLLRHLDPSRFVSGSRPVASKFW